MKRLLFICLLLTLCACSKTPPKPKYPASGFIKEPKPYELVPLEKRIGQMFMVSVSEQTLKENPKVNFGGFLLFHHDLKDFDQAQFKDLTHNLKVGDITPLIAVDEEGGEINRVSLNPKLIKTPFKGSRKLYKEGGLELIETDALNKANLLSELGINTILAPVCDYASNDSYIAKRTIGVSRKLTSDYCKVVSDSFLKNHVFSALKHFPGYGDNVNTHTGSSTLTISKQDYLLNRDVFKAAIDSGALMVMLTHGHYQVVDPKYPASISKIIIDQLRNDLGFKGIVISDDISMKAFGNLSRKDVLRLGLLAGVNMFIDSGYDNDIDLVKQLIAEGSVPLKIINDNYLKLSELKAKVLN